MGRCTRRNVRGLPVVRTHMNASARAMWDVYCASARSGSTYRLVAFGDTAELQASLAELVVSGRKRATTSLLRWYASGDEEMPVPGGYGVVVDGAGDARCVIRTTTVDVMPFREVDAAFAFDEGEGDRTLASWRAVHRSFFTREAAQQDFAFTEDTEVVCERFELVWNGSNAA